jgi:MFS family permease
VRPLKESVAYRRLWATQALSAIGTVISSVAVAAQVYSLTGSSLSVGMIGLARGVPLIVFGLLGGAIADATDRRRLAVITSSLLATVAALFAVQAWLDFGQVWLLYLLTVAQSGLFATETPAVRTFMPRLIREELYPAASALFQLSFQVSMIVGALAGGVLIGAFGTSTAYAINAVSFVVAIYGVVRLPPMPVEGPGGPPAMAGVLAGIRFVRKNSILSTVLLADIIGTVLAMPQALFPAIATTHFHGGAETLGLLYAAPAIGGVLGATFSGRLSHVRRQGLAVLVAVAVWGATIAGFALTSMLWLAVALLAVAGAADMVNGVFRSTLLQVHAPDALRGRVNSVGYVVGFAGPSLGGVRAGAVASLTTPVVSAVAGGLICVAGVAVIGLVVPGLAGYRSKAATGSSARSDE